MTARVDATADPQAFNFVGAVAREGLKPMAWAEVYAGGIGGFVARLWPDVEPPPHVARRQYLRWCERQGVPWQWKITDEAMESGAGAGVAVADDADVAVIAAHASRIAVDVLLRPEASLFPHPAYVIGLQEDWIFDALLNLPVRLILKWRSWLVSPLLSGRLKP